MNTIESLHKFIDVSIENLSFDEKIQCLQYLNSRNIHECAKQLKILTGKQ